MTVLLFASSLATVFLIRIMPLVLWGRPDLSTGDVINHLNLIDGFRDNRHRLPDFQKKFLLSDAEDYPVLYHWMLSFLPQRVVDQMEPVFGAFVETIHGALVFAAAFVFAQGNSQEPRPETVAFFATLMFAATPLLLGIENYGRVFRLSARPVGVLLTAVTFTSTVCFLHTENYAWIAIGGIAVGLVALSSHFGLQAAVFITAFMCLIASDARPLFIFVIGFVVGTIISRGHLLRVLRGCIGHSYFYCTYLSTRHPGTTDYTIRGFILWPLTLITNPARAAHLLLTHYLFISFTLFPWSILLLATYAIHPQWIRNDNTLERLALLWYLSGLLCMFITSTAWFRFLGEASRYIIHSVTPVCILVSYRLLAINDKRLWTLALAATVVSIGGVVCNYWVSFAVRSQDAARKQLYDWISRQPQSTILTIDLRLGFLLCFRTPHRTVNYHINAPRGKKLDEYKSLISDAYPWPNSDLKPLIRQYHVDLLVVDHKAAELFTHRTNGKQYNLSPFTVLYEVGRFSVYSTSSSRELIGPTALNDVDIHVKQAVATGCDADAVSLSNSCVG